MSEETPAVLRNECTRKLSVSIDEGEFEEKATELVGALKSLRTLEAEKASYNATANKEKKDLNKQIVELTNLLSTGSFEDDVECEEVHDYGALEVYVVRKDTDEEVDRRPMTDEEKSSLWAKNGAPGPAIDGTGGLRHRLQCGQAELRADHCGQCLDPPTDCVGCCFQCDYQQGEEGLDMPQECEHSEAQPLDAPDYESMSMAELKALAKERGIKMPTKDHEEYFQSMLRADDRERAQMEADAA